MDGGDLMTELTWGKLGRKLYDSAKLSRVPISGQFELTARCNLHCKMCYVCKYASDKEAMSKERTAEEWLAIAREAKEAGMLYLLITGGEVFLRKDFMYIYSELVKMGFHIEIYTNATMITPDIAKALGRIPPSKIGITIYGASYETYERVCGNGNAFNLAIRGIDLLLAEGITVWLKTTIVKGNVKDFYNIAKIAEERGIELGMISYISPRREGCGTFPEAERLSPFELVKFREDAGRYFESKSGQAYNIDYEDGIEEKEIQEADEEIKEKEAASNKDAFNCIAGKCAFWITWDGRMTPCALMDEPYSHPFEEGFKNAWVDVQKGCALIPSCYECKQCEHKDICMPCPARLKIETGFYDKAAPYLCEVMRESYAGKEVITSEEVCETNL